MWTALGIDIISISRLQNLSPRAKAKNFSPRELEQCQIGTEQRQAERMAGKFAAKEAVLKVLQTGKSAGIKWHEVEVLNKANGAPQVFLSGKALEIAQIQKKEKILVSIAHEGGQAVAIAGTSA
ncbi:MAG: holo-ACP synthase [Fibrobacter sp.]|nr:holo-ACP synthase [Fibrobacter sp.]